MQWLNVPNNNMFFTDFGICMLDLVTTEYCTMIKFYVKEGSTPK